MHAVRHHIACDGDSRSEIVVPVKSGGKVVAVIDVDSADTATFDLLDRKWLEEISNVVGDGCDW